MQKIIIYSKFERFWHWTQMLLILILLVTGLEIHGDFRVLGFEQSVRLHNSAAWSFMVLTAITVFWMFSVGHWRNFIPTTQNLKEQIQYYTWGIFKNAPSPQTDKSRNNKFNPLQKIVYLLLIIVAFPAQIITGLLYMYFRYPGNPVDSQALEAIAIIHTLLAYLMVAFLIIHIYMSTTGQSVSSHVKEMITGESIPHEIKTDSRITEKKLQS